MVKRCFSLTLILLLFLPFVAACSLGSNQNTGRGGGGFGVPGVKKWEFLTGGFVESSPAIGGDGTVYIGSDDGNLFALDPSNGLLKWAYKAGGSVFSTAAIAP